jgi:cytochrome c
MMRAVISLLWVALAAPALAAEGQQAFESDCASCHTLNGVSTPSGPSLKGVVWRKVADLHDFDYTGALKGVVGTWTPDRLDAYLKNTQKFAPGTSMFFDIQDAAERKAIIAYLKTVK